MHASRQYLAQMFELEEKDRRTWNFFKQGNFSVNKTNIPFSAIGADHAIEHENRSMNVLDGIKGIANNQAALDQYFLIAPEVNIVLDRFHSVFDLDPISYARDEHYQLSGGINDRLNKNVSRLKDILISHDVSFEDSDNLSNVITKVVLPEQAAQQLLSHEEEGEKLLNNFINERILGEKSIWDTLPKRKLPTFAASNSTVKVTLQNKVVTLKEERSLLVRFAIAARSRPEIDLPKYLGDYELSVVPRSMFSGDGELLLGNDKSVLIHEIERISASVDTPTTADSSETVTELTPRVIVFDGMAVVNQIKKTPLIKSCVDFAKCFADRILFAARNFEEVRVVFDQYITDSLKNATQKKRTGGVQKQYNVRDNTALDKTSMKDFLSHIETKKQLTVYLGHYISQALSTAGKRFAVSYGQITEHNLNRYRQIC